MIRGAILLAASMIFLQGAISALGFAIRYNRFPESLAELYYWLF